MQEKCVPIWREKVRPASCTIYKLNSRWIKGSSVKSKTSRLGRNNVEECFYDKVEWIPIHDSKSTNHKGNIIRGFTNLKPL